MSKIMLVEDDNSLREIYSIRLTAEGYTIVSAGDGEEALAVAVRERPDLIISDVMMPKISGFDMLDILRSTPETKNIKVIMMTALSSEDQRQRGESLGADRYLVKSQVGIEDVVNVVHDMLGDRAADGTINPTTPDNDQAPVSGEAPVMDEPSTELGSLDTTAMPEMTAPMQTTEVNTAPVVQPVADANFAPSMQPTDANAVPQPSVAATAPVQPNPPVVQPVQPNAAQ